MSTASRIVWLVLLVLSGLLGAWAPKCHAEPDGRAPQAIRETAHDGLFVIDGTFSLEPGITLAQAWNVLSDYGHLSEFISSIRKSAVLGHRPDGAVVEQVAEGKWLLFSRSVSVLLDVREVAQRSIAFRDVSHRDFIRYEGSWTLVPVNGAVRVDYHLAAQPTAALPSFVVERVFASDAAALLEQVRDEILRRAGHI